MINSDPRSEAGTSGEEAVPTACVSAGRDEVDGSDLSGPNDDLGSFRAVSGGPQDGVERRCTQVEGHPSSPEIAGPALNDTASSDVTGSPHTLAMRPADNKEQGQYPVTVALDIPSSREIVVPRKVNMKLLVEKEQDLYPNQSSGCAVEPRENNVREDTDS